MFSPWVFETLGRPGGEVIKSLGTIAQSVLRPQRFIQEFLTETALSLQTANAELLQSALINAESSAADEERKQWVVPKVQSQLRRQAEKAHRRIVERLH